MTDTMECHLMCRLCLVKEQVNIPIFEEQGNLHTLQKITTCLPLKVTREDRLPKSICDGCNFKLDQQYQFWNTSVNAEKQLKSWLGIVDEPPPKVKKEKEVEEATVSKRPRRNARRKAAANARKMAAIPSDSDDDNRDFDSGHTVAKEEAASDVEYNENDSLEPTTFVNVSLQDPEQAGPSGVQKSGSSSSAPATATSNTEAGNGPVQYGPASVTNTNNSYDAFKSSRLFNPLMHISSNNTYSDMYDDAQLGVNDSYQEPYQYDGVSQNSFSNVLSPVCYTDETSNYSNTSLTESFKNFEQFENKRKLTAKEKKEQKLNSMTADGKYECSVCQQQFETNFKLQYHIKSAHEERRFKCEVCLKAFLTAHHLKMHSAIHVEIKPFGCDQCSASFRYKKLLDRHVTSYHITPSSCTESLQPVANDTNLPFACSQCELRFATRNAYNHHTKTHKTQDNLKGTTRFPCDVCGKELATRESLNVHKMSHAGEKNLLCNICNKAFSHKKYLQVHQRIHSGLKPYICSTCGKSFTQASTLTVHRRYHSGERPYTCNICNKGFVTRTIMLTHMKKHT